MLYKINVIVFIFALFLSPISNAGIITYSYVGPDFEYPDPLPAPYTTGDHIEGFVTIDDSFLDPSGVGYLSDTHTIPSTGWLIDFSFTDGVKTVHMADLSSLVEWRFELYFNEFELDHWIISLLLSYPVPHSSIATRDATAPVPAIIDRAWDPRATSEVSVYHSPPSLGIYGWTRESTIPEPSAIALMGLGLLGFVAIRRKRQK